MKITVKKFLAKKNYSLIFPKYSEYIKRQCPICDINNNSVVISQVMNEVGEVYIESSFCKDCEHKYYSKQPSEKFILDYYKENWDNLSSDNFDEYIKLLMQSKIFWSIFNKLKYFKFNFFPFLHSRGQTGKVIYLIKDMLQNKQKQRILEIGSGYGGTISMLKEMGHEVYALEASENRAYYCRKRSLNVVKNISDVKNIDLVFSVHVLEHISDINTTIQDIYSVLKEDGVAYIQVPLMKELIESDFLWDSHSIVHLHSFSVKSLIKLLRKYNFSIENLYLDDSLHVLVKKTKRKKNFLSLIDKTYILNENTIYEDIFKDVKTLLKMKKLEKETLSYSSNVLTNENELSFPIKYIHSTNTPPLLVSTK